MEGIELLHTVRRDQLQDFLDRKAAELRIPRKCQPGRVMRPPTEEEVHAHLEAFGLREKFIARLAIFEGMRPGEILALRWKPLASRIIQVEERVYKRVFNTPKNGKPGLMEETEYRGIGGCS